MIPFITGLIAQAQNIPIPDHNNLVQWLFWVIVVAFFAMLGFFLKMVASWSDMRSLLVELVSEVRGLKEAITEQNDTSKLVREVASLTALLTGKVTKLEDNEKGR